MNQLFLDQLKSVTQEGAVRELRLMVAHIKGASYEAVFSDWPELSLEEEIRLGEFVQRRVQGEPLSKILGSREFYGRVFHVKHSVLDPRPDTETLIDAVLKCAVGESPHILDLGTGTGCLPITLLCEWPRATAVAVDVSQDALEVARENAHLHGVSGCLTLVESNWLDRVTGIFDIIISNPPYIDPVEELENSVKNYDPHLALYAGEGGLEAYKAILPGLKAHMHSQTQCFFEIGYQQKQSVCGLIDNAGYTVSKVYQDLSGHHRVIQFNLG